MYKFFLIALVIGLTAVSGSFGGQDPQAKTEAPFGWFVVESIERDPDLENADVLKGMKFFLGCCKGPVENTNGQGVARLGTEWDPMEVPGTVDLIVRAGKVVGLGDVNETALGIYEWKGESLRICLARPGAKHRPTQFATPKGSGQMLITFKMKQG